MSRVRYPKYKPTGIAWLPEVPEGWSIGRVKNFASVFGRIGFRGYTTADIVGWGEGALSLSPSNLKEGYMDYAKRTYISWKKYDESPEIKVRDGDIVFVKTGSSYGKACVVKDLPCETTLNPQLVVLNNIRCNNKFLAYSFQIPFMKAQVEFSVVGGTIPTLAQSKLLNFMFPMPDVVTQESIVAYLDEKCGKVGRLVAAKEKEAALLKELKQSMIAEAVTGTTQVAQTDTARKMKPSGIPWLPEVPEGWELRKMKYLFVEKSDKGHPDEQPLCSTQAYGVIPQSLYENRVVVVNKEGLGQLKLVEVGDFVISLRSFQGGIEIAHYQGIISAAYTILEPRDEKCSPYFRYLFKSHKFIQLLQTCVTGIREGQNINYPLLSRKFIPVPPLAEQREIVAHIEARAAKIDAAVKGLEREVAALKEYRERLIADVVTGQRKVV